MIEPSPETVITVRSGAPSFAPSPCGQAKAHCAQTARGDVIFRLVEITMLRDPHLMLANVASENRGALIFEHGVCAAGQII